MHIIQKQTAFLLLLYGTCESVLDTEYNGIVSKERRKDFRLEQKKWEL